jgi:hypothetical protein
LHPIRPLVSPIPTRLRLSFSMNSTNSTNGFNPSNDYLSESSESEEFETPVNLKSTRLSRGKPKSTDETTVIPRLEQNNKVFFLPTMNEETFIDHGCTLDAEGYPLLPNGNTIFVKPSGTKITNFGNVGFAKRTGSEYRSKGIWKLTRIYCLGTLACDLPQCRWAGAPPTGRGDMTEYLQRFVTGFSYVLPWLLAHHWQRLGLGTHIAEARPESVLGRLDTLHARTLSSEWTSMFQLDGLS